MRLHDLRSAGQLNSVPVHPAHLKAVSPIPRKQKYQMSSHAGQQGHSTASALEDPPRWALAIHGGAGVINSNNEEWLADAKRGLAAALTAGQSVLASGGSAIDAVVAAVMCMEDDPHFNAGRGQHMLLLVHQVSHMYWSVHRQHKGSCSWLLEQPSGCFGL